jgi:hypothetical protein
MNRKGAYFDVRIPAQSAEPEVKRAWSQAKNAAVSFGHSVRNFFTNLGGARGAQ